MTHIKSITLRGFKSFAKETTVEFGEDFSCVVGPNGSGKSNISDGILFVLGKLGSKGLRAGKSANLIFNGGEGGRPASEAIVTLKLDNSTRTFPLDLKEIDISRIVRRNGTSIYKINNETRTRQEVIDLLGKAGITPQGFNIILQDSISRFVEMKPEDRRKLIEDIAGISVYEEKKKHSLRELNKTSEKLKEINIILKERGNHLTRLANEKRQALFYNKIKEDIEIAKASLLLKNILRKETEKDNLGKNHIVEKEKLEKAIQEISVMQKNASKIFTEISQVSRNIEDATGKEQGDIRQGLMDAKMQITSLEAKKGNLTERIRSTLDREKQFQYELEESEKSLITIRKKLREKPEKFDFKGMAKKIGEDEKNLTEHVGGLIGKIREIREKKTDKQELINFLETIENVCLIINELIIKIKGNRDALASPEKFADATKLEVNQKILGNEISRVNLLIKQGKDENKRLEIEIKEIDKNLGTVSIEERASQELEKGFEKKFKDLFERRRKLDIELKEKQELINEKEKMQWQVDSILDQINIENVRLEEDLKNLKENLIPYGEVVEKARVLKKSEDRLKEEIEKKQARVDQLGGINQKALEVYDEAKKEYDQIVGKSEGLELERLEILNVIVEIDKSKKKEFMKTFEGVSEKFHHIFTKLSIKGTAELILENKVNPFEDGTGIDIKIKLGRGKYLDTRSLSGGEKSFTAIAFIFAIQEFKPHCFYLLDEVDAALDKRNSERLAILIKEYVKKAQYIAITHNDSMIGAADRLYGVSMQKGISKVISLKL